MKKQTNHLFIPIGKAQIENIYSSENETLINGFHQSNHKVFTAADLWNIQRTCKRGLQKKHLF